MFARRKAATGANAANTVAQLEQQQAGGVASMVGVLPYGQPGPREGYVTGWKAMPGAEFATPNNQTGAFAGQLLNQYPAYLPGVQLRQGREYGNSAWYTPTQSYVPNGTIQLTQQHGQVPGGQRSGSRYQGGIGPVTARGYKANVTKAQAAQSGLEQLAFASNLNLL